ncbi:MAG: hypothetical protein MUO51_07750 [Woeseiaceae bacterium]|nr:hypothetical protein [Woeseiaceae bacterium]
MKIGSVPTQANFHEAISNIRSIVEDKRLGKDVREAALFALAQSNSDKAYAYIDTLLSQR